MAKVNRSVRYKEGRNRHFGPVAMEAASLVIGSAKRLQDQAARFAGTVRAMTESPVPDSHAHLAKMLHGWKDQLWSKSANLANHIDELHRELVRRSNGKAKAGVAKSDVPTGKGKRHARGGGE